MVNDDLLREREFKNAPVTLMLDPSPQCQSDAAHHLRPRAGRQTLCADHDRSGEAASPSAPMASATFTVD
jgi:hypothetical protein